MKKVLVTNLILLLGLITFAQSPIGVWKTVDDETKEAKSHIKIYEKDGKIYGQIIKLLGDDPDALCVNCKGDKKNKPIVGLVILDGLEKVGKKWKNGKITDPGNGKTYSCLIELKSKDKLKVRGYIGNPLFGRSQYWYRIK